MEVSETIDMIAPTYGNQLVPGKSEGANHPQGNNHH